MPDSLPILLRAGPVPLLPKDFDVRTVVKSPFRFLRYSSVVPEDGVAISYVGLPPVSGRNLSIREPDVRHYENADYVRRERRIEGQVFSTVFDDFLLTDIFRLRPGGETVPLFWRHDLSAETSVTDVEVVDRNGNEVEDDLWTWDAAARILYHSLRIQADPKIGEYDIWFLRWVDANDERRQVLLRSDPAFTRHTLADGPIDPTTRTWSIQDAGSTHTVTIHFNAPASGANVYRFEGLVSGQIRPVPPANDIPTESWFMRFTNGEVYANTGTGVRRYTLPEWWNQAFQPVPPFRMSGFSEAHVLSPRLIQARRRPLEVDTAVGRWLDILVTDGEGRGLRAYTNRPSTDAQGVFWFDVSGRPTNVRTTQLSTVPITFDPRSGIIHMDVDLEPDERVVLKHWYEEEHLEYLGWNFNPIFNQEAISNLVLFYVRSNVGPGVQALHHISFDNETLAATAYSDPALSVGGASILLADLAPEWNTLERFRANAVQLLIVANVGVVRTSIPQDVVTIDTRIRGGGIREDIDIHPWLREFPELSFHADIANWDGRPYPARLTAWIELPWHLVSGRGSLAPPEEHLLTVEEIRQIVRRHMALGAYPIIRWYGDRPEILSLSRTTLPNGDATDTTNTSITFSWSEVPGATGYVPRLSRGRDGGYEALAEQTALTVTVNGLENNSPWYVYVTPQFDGRPGLKSDTAYILPGSDSNLVTSSMDAILASGPSVVASLDAIISFRGGEAGALLDAVLA